MHDRCKVFICLPLGEIARRTQVRWNIAASKETDLTPRALLGSRGMKKGDLSKFIEQAVRAHVFHRTVEDTKARNAVTDLDELQCLIDDTVREVRAERRAKRTPGEA